MVINWAILVISLLFGYGFATGSEVPAEATVQIQYNGEEGSGIITMTRPTPTHEAFITTTFQSTKNTLGTGTASIYMPVQPDMGHFKDLHASPEPEITRVHKMRLSSHYKGRKVGEYLVDKYPL
ncbi:hypothetical protein F5884DRAFT_890324 [Xylogone sp. PMI_703]|nr:hypothetical protein F5884DRAFT_890324 [Xylogone sp. PMI_703]